jgi:hypothetical protein
MGYKNATQVKALIDLFGLATVAGKIQLRGCIMADEAQKHLRARARREKRAANKAMRREGEAEAAESRSNFVKILQGGTGNVPPNGLCSYF